MSLVCYMLVNRWERFLDRSLAKCLFIGRNTIWIYLYHIPLIQVTGMLALPWWMRYLVVYGLAVAMCYAQVALVERISSKHDSPIYKYFKG